MRLLGGGREGGGGDGVCAAGWQQQYDSSGFMKLPVVIKVFLASYLG